jgi:hypothetical protein
VWSSEIQPTFHKNMTRVSQTRNQYDAGTKQSVTPQKTELFLADSVLLDLTSGLRVREEKSTNSKAMVAVTTWAGERATLLFD